MCKQKWCFRKTVKLPPVLTVFVDSYEERLVSFCIPPQSWNLYVVDVWQRHLKFTENTNRHTTCKRSICHRCQRQSLRHTPVHWYMSRETLFVDGKSVKHSELHSIFSHDDVFSLNWLTAKVIKQEDESKPTSIRLNQATVSSLTSLLNSVLL